MDETRFDPSVVVTAGEEGHVLPLSSLIDTDCGEAQLYEIPRIRQLPAPTPLGSVNLKSLPEIPTPTGLVDDETCWTSVGTGVDGTAAVAAETGVEYPLRLPVASIARTR